MKKALEITKRFYWIDLFSEWWLLASFVLIEGSWNLEERERQFFDVEDTFVPRASIRALFKESSESYSKKPLGCQPQIRKTGLFLMFMK